MHNHKTKFLLLMVPVLIAAVIFYWFLNERSKDRQLAESLPREFQFTLEQSSQFTILSLFPLPPPAEDDSADTQSAEEDSQFKNHEKFHGYPVLGKFEVKDQQLKEQLLSALYQGIRDVNDEEIAACFNPRHGIRAIHNGKIIEMVICFGCRQFHIFATPKLCETRYAPISRSAQPVFDRALQNANVPIAHR